MSEGVAYLGEYVNKTISEHPTSTDAIGALLSELRPHRYADMDILAPFAVPSRLCNQGRHSITRADATAKPLALAAKFIAYSLLKSCFITLRSLIYLSDL